MVRGLFLLDMLRSTVVPRVSHLVFAFRVVFIERAVLLVIFTAGRFL